MGIETMAIYYQPGTPAKNCSLCYAVESHLALGLICSLNHLPTTSAGWCGMGHINEKPDESEPVKQGELFTQQGLTGTGNGYTL
jgi:hypothetical protein